MRVAIIGYSQTKFEYDVEMTREEMVFKTAKDAIESAGLTREDIGTVISASTDFLDGRTISNCMLIGATGAYLKDETKAEEDGMYAVLYACQRILAGIHDVALVVAHTHSWIFNPHQVSVYMLDPLFDRQNDLLNDITLAALQAKAYMKRSNATEDDLALVSVKNLKNASNNPYALRKMPDATIEDVLKSKIYANPIRELMVAPPCDGAAAVVVASEDFAKKYCENPVWIEGIGNSCDAYLRDRDLSRLVSLEIASRKAYDMAGISDPYREIDVFEVTERFSHQELMIYEELGICGDGRGANFIRMGITDFYGDCPVNPSGGALSGDAICATGLVRLIEVVKQIVGEAENQIDGVQRGLAHAQWGLCAQKNLVFILGGDYEA